MKTIKKIKQVAAWLGILVIVGLVITTFILGISGSTLTIPMLILTMGTSIVIWVMLWFLKILERRSEENKQ